MLWLTWPLSDQPQINLNDSEWLDSEKYIHYIYIIMNLYLYLCLYLYLGCGSQHFSQVTLGKRGLPPHHPSKSWAKKPSSTESVIVQHYFMFVSPIQFSLWGQRSCLSWPQSDKTHFCCSSRPEARDATLRKHYGKNEKANKKMKKTSNHSGLRQIPSHFSTVFAWKT